jgi:2-dehydropantoate 2-reductase
MEHARKCGRYGLRDATMILIAYRHGLRPGELCALRWDQIDFAQWRPSCSDAHKGPESAGPRGDAHLSPTYAINEPASIGTVDVVLFCVNLWEVEIADAAIRPLIDLNTAVRERAAKPDPWQGGRDGGVAQISATIAEPGVICQTGAFMGLVFGELEGRPSQRGAAFHSLCQRAGFDSVNSDAILTALWEKFVLLATNSSVVALARLPICKLCDEPEGIRSVREGRGRGCRHGPRPRRYPASGCRGQDTPVHAQYAARIVALDGSQWQSIFCVVTGWNCRGLGGEVLALGRELGVPTPTHEIMYAPTKPSANGAPA